MAERIYRTMVLKQMSTKDLQDAYTRLTAPKRYNEVDEFDYQLKQQKREIRRELINDNI